MSGSRGKPGTGASLDAVMAFLRAGDLRRAERDARELLDRAPERAERLHLYGCVCLARGRVDDAVLHLERAVDRAPVEPAYHEDLAFAYLRRGEPERAASEAELARRCGPGRARPLDLMGLSRLERGDPVAAMESFAQAIEAEPPNPEAMNHMVVAMNRAGLWTEAERWARTLLRIEPQSADAWVNLGLALKAQRRFDQARDAFTRAGEGPAARFNLGYVSMQEGDLVTGLPLLEARKALLGTGRALTRPEWDGRERLGKTLLVIDEQGLGDTLLMCRFWPALRERFGRVVALAPVPLTRLLAAVFPAIEVVTSLDGVAYDTWTATMSLPYRLGLDARERIPLEPWLRLPPRDAAAREAAGAPPPGATSALRAGINWAGNPKYAYDTVRSCHLGDLALLLRVPGVEWVSLHRGHREHEAEAAGLPQPLADARDFLDTAEAVAGLDLVVSTETAVPNLSAAMGIPTCVLASPDWDWRWAHWYPGVTVCAQERPGDWTSACVRALEVIRDTRIAREAGAAA